MSTAKHYESHSPESYEDAYFYSPGLYMEHLVNLVSKSMKLDSIDRARHLIDLGGGTGNFAKELTKKNLNLNITVVEPYLEETSSLVPDERVAFVKEPAEAFLRQPGPGDGWRKGIDQILCKELVHHFDGDIRSSLFRGMHDNLAPSRDRPSLLIITRPLEVDYPLWDEARRVWRENQPGSDSIMDDLGRAGFVDVEERMEPFGCKISLRKWQGMVRRRFWSTFSKFSDEELEDGCRAIESERPPDQNGEVHFEDRLLFITARKAPDSG